MNKMVQNNFHQMMAQLNENIGVIGDNQNSSIPSSQPITFSPNELTNQDNFNYPLHPDQVHLQNFSFHDRNLHYSNHYNCIARISPPKNNIPNEPNFFNQKSQFLQNIPNANENLSNPSLQSKPSKTWNLLHIK